MKKITVFTPTYNRAYIIENLYHSLQRQSFTDFEWLVVDDGSTDDTAGLFERIAAEENSFLVRYYRQENGGKCRAINYGLDLAEGELFFVVDSDDYLTDDALEKVILWEQSLPVDGKFCGVAGNIGTSVDYTSNRVFENEYFDGTFLDRYKNVDGERAIVIYTEIFRRYKYPVVAGEKFMTEAVSWNRMANEGYKMRFYNDVIWVYEYLDDGLTKAGNKLFLNNPQGYGLWLHERAEFMHFSMRQKLKMYYAFTCELYQIYDVDIMADCIKAPRMIISLNIVIHNILKIIKGRKK